MPFFYVNVICYVNNVTVIDIDHFYSLAVKAGFYGDTGRVTGFFTKLSNGDHSQYLDG